MSLAGPWEPNPTNPVLQNLNNGADPDHPFEGPQHSELIQTQNGEWFRHVPPWESRYGTLARNMCLEPVIWTDDGWWRPKNGRQPNITNDGPNLPYTPYEIARSEISRRRRWARMVLPHHAGLVGSQLVPFGQSGLPADSRPATTTSMSFLPTRARLSSASI
jgi:hypothetical protein